ncbi:MAG: TRASH domain-containing protein [Ignavibacteriales bacterium]|nr:TRASH domain-containing protein [Ignavibacteriales bacterium]
MQEKINPNKVYANVKYGEETYYLCCPICQEEFEKELGKFIDKLKM